MDAWTREEILSELTPQAQPLVLSILDHEFSAEVLELFHQRLRTWLQADDVSYYVHRPLEKVVAALCWLTDMGIVKSHFVAGQMFFELTRESETVSALNEYWRWREHWVVRLDQVRHALRLGGTEATLPPVSPTTYTATPGGRTATLSPS